MSQPSAAPRRRFASAAGCAGAALALLVGTLRADVELVGVMRVQGDVLVALQRAPASTATWVRVGERWGDYLVRAYDPVRDVVVLATPQSRLDLPLREAHVGRLEAVVDVTEDETRRGIQLAARAAYQVLFDAGRARISAAEALGGRAVASADLAGCDFVVADDHRLLCLSPSGLASEPTLVGPVHILVDGGTALTEVARRLRCPVEPLARLNPGYVTTGASGIRHTVRVR